MNKQLSLTIVTLLVLSCFIAFHINAPVSKPQKIRFLSAVSAPQKQMVLTYDFDMKLSTLETSGDLSHSQENTVRCKSKAKFSPVYDAKTKSFNVIVDYSRIQFSKSDPKLDNKQSKSKYTETTNEKIEMLYVATIHADSGKIIKLTKTGGDDDKMVDYLTRMQLAQIFPDIRRTTPGLLSQGVEETEIGTVVPHETTFIDEDDDQIIEKYYTEEDMINSNLDWVQHAQVQVEFEEVLKADPDNLIVKSGKQSYDFYYEIEELLSESETGDDIVGDMEVHVDTELEIESVVYDEEYGMQVNQILDQISEGLGDFKNVTTDIAKANVFINDQSDVAPQYVFKGEDGEDIDINDMVIVDMDDNLLRQSAPPLYTKDYDVASHDILGKNIKLQTKYTNYGNYSNLTADILVDNTVIRTIYNIPFKHCGGGFEHNINLYYKYKLFEMQYPIFYFITFEVQAQLAVHYGFDSHYGGSKSQEHGCELQIKPYFKPGMSAYAGVNILIAKGGMYASGFIANTYMNFNSNIKGFPPALTGSIKATLEIKPFEFVFGAWYQFFYCDFMELFQWLPRFDKVCGYTDINEHRIDSYGVGQVQSYDLFNYNFRM